MNETMREPTLQTLGLGTVLDIFKNGRLPAEPEGLVEEIFGVGFKRGSLVISGANGIVGAGKTMQLGSRLHPYGVPVVALDLPGAPDGLGAQYPGLVQAFGKEGADSVMAGIIRMSYDGMSLPDELKELRPRFLLEAIPEILEVKKNHYEVFRQAFPDIYIRSVTSGFPSSELGVGIAHPAFPHEINKIWEVVEPEPSAVTQLLWALGLIPVPVSDHWSFVLDVLFCGVTLAGLRYHEASNMPFWKIDKLVRKLVGPNPFRAHDVIGAQGADFLTWSCLHHLSGTYGEVFRPTTELEVRKETGQTWYPPNHFRPLVDWKLGADEEETFRTWILGPLYQMASLMIHEGRGHFANLNAIGELCAQFRKGIVAMVREAGVDSVIETVEAYHALHPEAAKGAWHPGAFGDMEAPEWQQLYVNAEHDGEVGVITISRESYSWDVDAEVNRAVDWLKEAGIERVILTGDFHLSTQMIGADISEFFPAVEEEEAGFRISSGWSRTARRLDEEFQVSVGVVNGKRALGGMLELLMHCHYLVAVDGAQLGMPEITLPVVPGMEGCHWPFRKSRSEDWGKVLTLLLGGQSVHASDAVGWLVDYTGSLEDTLAMAWTMASGGEFGMGRREVESGVLEGVPTDVPDLPAADGEHGIAARAAFVECIQGACGATLSEALEVQARHSAAFMTSKACKKGELGNQYTRTMVV
jgi:enoyl-CoA hydratase/carnithine racemase/3-hydroxyacyl-CoA dehydrogenase